MLRTALLRNELLKETFKKSLRINTARSLSIECSRRRHKNNSQPCLLKSAQKAQWKKYETIRFYADLPPHQKVALPALSPTMETGTIVSWEKKEGDKLNEGDLLAEIETDKATMGFETPEEGYLAKIIIAGGTKNVPIGKLVCIIVQNQSDVAAFKDFKDDGSQPSGAPSPKAPAAAAPSAAPPAPASPTAPSAAPSAPSAEPPTPAGTPGKRVYASPMAKRLAEQRKIRLEGVKGTGLYDSVTSKDLPAAGAATLPPPTSAKAKPAPGGKVPSGAAYTDIPLSSMRITIAKRLLQSKQTIPHYYLTTEVNVDELMALRIKFNEMLAKEKIKLSVNDFLIKAMALTQRKVPEANSMWMDTVIRQFTNVDVSVAVSTDKGLITPIVFNADNKGLIEISKEVKSLATKARTNKLQPHEFQGGTITISNIGMFGINAVAPIINPPQSVILGVGKTTKKLVLDDSEKGFKETEVLHVTASCDHRVLDGAVGAKWLSTFRDFVEDPRTMIL